MLLLVAVVLGGGVWIYDAAIAPKQEERQAQQQQVFDFEMERIRGMTLEREAYTIQLTRLAEPGEIRSEDGTTFENANWEYTILKDGNPQGEATPANEAYVVFLLSVLENAKVDRSIEIEAEEIAEYGLDEPVATLQIDLDSGETHRLAVGTRDFSDSFVYGTTDSSEGEALTVLLLPTNLDNAVDRTLEDWKAQPPQSPESQLEPPPTPETDDATETPTGEEPDSSENGEVQLETDTAPEGEPQGE